MARQMKDSGVEWIGEIPDTWSLSRVGSYISLVESGVSVNAGINPAGEGELGVLKTSCVSTGKFNPDENKAVNKDEVGRVGCPVRAGCLIVSRMNTPELVGACGYVEQSYPNIYLPDRLWQIHVNPGYSAKFAYYYLTSSLARSFYASIAVGTSSSMQNISQKEFSSMRCTCPPYVEQERIAIFLDAKCAEIDKVVEQTRATIEEYKKLKQAIITEVVTKGVRGARPMKPSGVEWIGDIPEEWEFTRVKHVINNYKAGPFGSALITANLLSKGDILVYTPEHIAKHTAELEGNLYLPNERQEEMAAFIVNEGDIIFPIVGSLGRAMLISGDMPKGIINQRLAKFCLVSDKIRSDFFLWLFAKSSFYSVYIDINCRGSIIVNLTKEIIKAMPLVLPSVEEQQEIAAYLDTKCAEIDRIIEKKEQLIEELGSYKKSLIYEYVTGKKEIKIHNYS